MWGNFFGTQRRYVYHGDRVLDETDDAGGLLARYTTESGSCYEPWLHMQRFDPSASRFPMYDMMGSMRGLLDENGGLNARLSLSAFGVSSPWLGTPTPFRYGGAWGYLTDPSGLLQLGARFYWPEVGRFLQQDPAPDGTNRYVYARNGPLVRVDPTGEVAPLIVGACVAVYKGVTVGAAIGNFAAAGWYAWEYAKCKNEALELCAYAKRRMDPGQYQQWVRTAKPGSECEELAQGALGRGVRALGWLFARFGPSFLRARPAWD